MREQFFSTTRELAAQVKATLGIKLLGNHEAMIVCFASSDPTVNTYSVADAMTKRGWSLNTLQNPPCVHLCVTVCHIGKNASFIKDLNEALEDCREAVRRGDKASGKAAIYGMASSMPSGPVEELLKVTTMLFLASKMLGKYHKKKIKGKTQVHGYIFYKSL